MYSSTYEDVHIRERCLLHGALGRLEDNLVMLVFPLTWRFLGLNSGTQVWLAKDSLLLARLPSGCDPLNLIIVSC